MIPKNTVVYDLEIRNNIDGKEITWADHHKMGVSSLVSFDYRDNRFHLYGEDNLHTFIQRLVEPKTFIVTFNGIGFDDKVLSFYNPQSPVKTALPPTRIIYPTPETTKYHIDILALIIKAYGRRVKLDDVLKATLGPESVKSGSGAFAPQMWQEKRLGELFDYNLVDTLRTKELLEFIHDSGYCVAYGSTIDIDLKQVFAEIKLRESNDKAAVQMPPQAGDGSV